MKQALIFVITTIAQLYLLVLLLRFWLPLVGADFRNPIAQGILKLTSPLVIPLRRVIPPIGRIDTATVIIAFAIQYLVILVVLVIYGMTPTILPIAITAVLDLVLLTLRLYTFAIFILVILSWVAPGTYNPATAFIAMLVEPVLRPVRRIIPSMGGLDLSPMAAIIALMALSILIGDYRPIPI
jgi:YggT family protein